MGHSNSEPRARSEFLTRLASSRDINRKIPSRDEVDDGHCCRGAACVGVRAVATPPPDVPVSRLVAFVALFGEPGASEPLACSRTPALAAAPERLDVRPIIHTARVQRLHKRKYWLHKACSKRAREAGCAQYVLHAWQSLANSSALQQALPRFLARDVHFSFDHHFTIITVNNSIYGSV